MVSFFRRVWRSLVHKRAHERTPTVLTVDWRVDGSSAHRTAPICDWSAGGAFLCTDEPKRVGAPLVLELATAQGWIQMRARVAWASARGMGLQFVR